LIGAQKSKTINFDDSMVFFKVFGMSGPAFLVSWTGFWMPGTGFLMPGTGCTGFGMPGAGYALKMMPKEWILELRHRPTRQQASEPGPALARFLDIIRSLVCLVCLFGSVVLGIYTP